MYDAEAAESDDDDALHVTSGRFDAYIGTSYRTLYLEDIGFAYRLANHNWADAEDIMQAAAMKLMRMAQRGEPLREKATAVHRRLIRNAAVDLFRRNSAGRRGGKEYDQELDADIASAEAEHDPEHVGLSAELRQTIVTAIRELSPPLRDVVELAWDPVFGDFQNRTQAEIAERLGIPTGTVKGRLFEARRKLAAGLRSTRDRPEEEK